MLSIAVLCGRWQVACRLMLSRRARVGVRVREKGGIRHLSSESESVRVRVRVVKKESAECGLVKGVK